MTPLEQPFERPEFDSLDLTIDTETADQYIGDVIKGLSTSTTDGAIKYRTTDGMLVAIVGQPETEREEVKATLGFRTAPAVEAATRKASKIQEALQPHAVT